METGSLKTLVMHSKDLANEGKKACLGREIDICSPCPKFFNLVMSLTLKYVIEAEDCVFGEEWKE